jgi:hypothetical protein
MLRKMFTLLVLLAVAIVATGMARKPQSATEPARMTTEELRARLGAPDLVVIDVRVPKDWSGSDMKIAGAVREEPGEAEAWAVKYPKEKAIVLYCT